MRLATIILFVASLSFLAGCAPSDTNASVHSETGNHDDHDHDDHDQHEHADDGHPQSFTEAVDKIETMGTAIVKAFKNDKPEDAHDDLHEIGNLLTTLPGLGNEAGYGDEDLAEIQSTSNSLLDSFGELDGALHGGDPPDVASVSAKIDKLVETLKQHSRI